MNSLHSRCAGVMLVGLAVAACAGAAPPPAAVPVAGNCLASGDGFLTARLRGALEADIAWDNGAMSCEGGARPDGRGIRATFAGPLSATQPGEAPRQLRLIFGIDLDDTAPGAAQVLPTNLTVIVEGEQLLFATRGNARCAVENLERRPLLAAGPGVERIHARGYCTSPATDASGAQRVLVSTFEFAGRVNLETSP